MSFRDNTEIRKNRFKIMSHIGGGSYGKVFEVEDRNDGIVKAMKAIKIIDPVTEKPDKTAATELRILKKLRGVPGIPVVYDDFCYKGYRCLVQEKFAGDLEKLRCRNRNSSFCSDTIGRIGFHLTEILKAVHARGILHRDLKADNVMVPYPGSADHLKLIDFGLATIFSHAAPLRLRRTRVSHGNVPFQTRAYAAPRLCHREKPQEKEDLLMMAYLLITLSDEWPFRGNPQQAVAKKEAFEDHPDRFLTNAQMFLLPAMKAICSQTHGVTPKYGQIQTELRRSIFRFNPSTPFNLIQNSQGQWILK